MNSSIVSICYLIASALFILGIKNLSKPRTAVRGNQLAASGMLIAVVVTLFDNSILGYQWIIAGIVIGAALGATMAIRVQMTNMPQMVAILNGSGGGASLFIAAASYLEMTGKSSFLPSAAAKLLQTSGNIDAIVNSVAITLTALIGAVTLSGSLIAYAKLQELLDGQPKRIPANKVINALLLLSSIAVVIILAIEPSHAGLFLGLVLAALLLGIFLVLPIGGADMPVVIALLNSYSGIAAAAAGFITGNIVLIVSGSLVGASGIILTRIMCVAMNRSLFNVLFGVMAEGGEKINADDVYTNVRGTSADEVAMMLETAQRVVIVPGFGLAMSQAQHAVRELADTLIARGTEVEYAIHPVAGRMPGHMNVLLAEAEVPYELLKEMDEINPTFEQTDVAIVIGANDVTNPMAREDKGSPIYGMPILNVDKARNVVVVKRSLSPGFAGLPNPLFNLDHTVMLYGDGKKAIIDITNSLKEAAK
jgi:H+-translocating NAD(P) transhydrogenase subunit beta